MKNSLLSMIVVLFVILNYQSALSYTRLIEVNGQFDEKSKNTTYDECYFYQNGDFTSIYCKNPGAAKVPSVKSKENKSSKHDKAIQYAKNQILSNKYKGIAELKDLNLKVKWLKSTDNSKNYLWIKVWDKKESEPSDPKI